MKKLLSFILAAAMAMSLSPAVITASAETVYGAEAFPDPNFREYMIEHFDTDGDKALSESELWGTNGFITLDLQDTGVENLSGFEYITAEAVSLYCDSNTRVISPIFKWAKNCPTGVVTVNFNCAPDIEMDFSNIPTAEFDENTAQIVLYNLDVGSGHDVDLSHLSNYNIEWLEIIDREGIQKGFSATNLRYLTIQQDYVYMGPPSQGVKDILMSAYNLMDFTAPGAYVKLFDYTNNLTTLYVDNSKAVSYDSILTDEDFKNIIDKGIGALHNLTLFNQNVTDFSPLKSSNINTISCFLAEFSQFDKNGNIILDSSEENIGNRVLETLLSIPSIKNIWLADYNVTDLTPLKNLNSKGVKVTLDDHCVALDYKDNQEIYDNFNKAGSFDLYIFKRNSFKTSYAWNTDDENLVFELSSNKKSFAIGDAVTEIVKVTNIGTKPADINLYFNVADNERNKINILSGGRKQSITNLLPGQSTKRTIVFSVNDDLVNYPNGSSSYFLNKLYSGVCVEVGSKTNGLSFNELLLQSENNISLNCAPNVVSQGESITVSGKCGYDMKSVQIKTSSNELIADIDSYNGKNWYKQDIIIPEKYFTEGKTSLSLKVVATDEEGRTYQSFATVNLTYPDDNSQIKVEDAFHKTVGSYQKYYSDTPAIIFWGNEILVRAKLSGIDESEIKSVEAVINDRPYSMEKIKSGLYKDYYSVRTDGGLNDTDSFSIKLRVTTTSGYILNKFVGYGKVLIDPSGIITDSEGRPIEGVKVTLQKKQEDGSWADWDAENYMQENPLYTNADGYYGWDVVEGTYRIIAEKEGYQTTIVERYYSRNQGEETAITVLPPRFDVDFSMEYADPENPPEQPMTDEEAKTLIETIITRMKLASDTDEQKISDRLNSLLPENMYISFKNGTYEKNNPTESEDGSVTGILLLEDTWKDTSQEFEVNIPIVLTVETVDTLPDFSDKLTIEKTYGNNGSVELTISPTENNTLPKLIIYTAVYTADGTLKSITPTPVDNTGYVSIAKPDISDNETYKIVLWTNQQTPVIPAITNVTEFFK